MWSVLFRTLPEGKHTRAPAGAERQRLPEVCARPGRDVSGVVRGGNGAQLLRHDWHPPDLPTPALPKTASFTSGLLAMTAAELSQSLSGGVGGQPSILSSTTQEKAASEETAESELLLGRERFLLKMADSAAAVASPELRINKLGVDREKEAQKREK